MTRPDNRPRLEGPSPAMSENTAPWYARAVSAVGRQAVLLAALAMSAPGEYHLAVLAGWSGWVAALMPLCLSVYAAAAAAVMAATRPAGASGRRSVVIGVGCALVLALAAQVTAHLIAAGFTATSVGMRSSVIGRTRPR